MSPLGRQIHRLHRAPLATGLVQKLHNVEMASARRAVHRRGSGGEPRDISREPLNDVEVSVRRRGVDRTCRRSLGAILQQKIEHLRARTDCSINSLPL